MVLVVGMTGVVPSQKESSVMCLWLVVVCGFDEDHERHWFSWWWPFFLFVVGLWSLSSSLCFWFWLWSSEAIPSRVVVLIVCTGSSGGDGSWWSTTNNTDRPSVGYRSSFGACAPFPTLPFPL